MAAQQKTETTDAKAKRETAAPDAAVAVHKQTLVDLIAAVEAENLDEAKQIAARIKL